jgi:glycosyltransferase involved in cell wall biosynthesis
MLSVLIPVYNYQITKLVVQLIKQIKESLVCAEIIIVDDASSMYTEENNKIVEFDEVFYERVGNNRGRAAIRNYLASKAKYDYLLFIDCDAKVKNPNFIKNYVQAINNNKEVVCGGLEYESHISKTSKLYFRWYYGIKREYRKAIERNKKPFKSFSSFNFLIRKDIFQKIKFNENLTKYGHEDTLFGIELKKRNYSISQIDNPLVHDGIDETSLFIQKTEQSVKNLKLLYKIYKDSDSIVSSIKLLRYIRIINKMRLAWLFSFGYMAFKNIILINLKSRFPSLLLFDLYKLCYYYTI